MTALLEQREHECRQKSGSEQPGENIGHRSSNIARRFSVPDKSGRACDHDQQKADAHRGDENEVYPLAGRQRVVIYMRRHQGTAARGTARHDRRIESTGWCMTRFPLRHPPKRELSRHLPAAIYKRKQCAELMPLWTNSRRGFDHVRSGNYLV